MVEAKAWRRSWRATRRLGMSSVAGPPVCLAPRGAGAAWTPVQPPRGPHAGTLVGVRGATVSPPLAQVLPLWANPPEKSIPVKRRAARGVPITCRRGARQDQRPWSSVHEGDPRARRPHRARPRAWRPLSRGRRPRQRPGGWDCTPSRQRAYRCGDWVVACVHARLRTATWLWADHGPRLESRGDTFSALSQVVWNSGVPFLA